MKLRRFNKLKLFIFSLCLCLSSHNASAESKKLRVIASTETVGEIVKMVGGDEVEVESLSRGTEDPHYIEAKPSFMVKVRDADLVVAVGLDLEDAWLVPVLRGGRNPKLLPGGPGFMSLGELASPIEAITGTIDRSQGDVHPKGNPHFYLDPDRVAKLLPEIAKKLAVLRPEKKSYFEQKASDHAKKLQDKLSDWKKRVKQSGVKSVITYHKTFQYPLQLFNIQLAITLEPKPGLPPTTQHILAVLDKAKNDQVTCILNENHFETTAAERVKKNSPIYIAKIPTEVGGSPEAKDYDSLIEALVRGFEACGQFQLTLSKEKSSS